jgi:hypothetical protein
VLARTPRTSPSSVGVTVAYGLFNCIFVTSVLQLKLE